MTDEKQSEKLISTGNAVNEAIQGNGWIMGHFIPQSRGLQCTKDLEIKWGEHAKGDTREEIGISESATTLTLLVSGKYEVYFPNEDRRIMLSERGDYVIYGPKIGHTWKVLEESLLITVRWPSNKGLSYP